MRAVDRFLDSGGGIMLLHDIQANTAAELPAILAALQTAGATFVDLSDGTLFPQLNANVSVPEAPACCSAVGP